MTAAWPDRAACAGIGPDLFYGGPAEHTEALKVCAACPVRSECLADALAVERHLPVFDVHGVRGGLRSADRVRLIRAEAPPVERRAVRAQCGSDSGYYRHRRLGEPVCDDCRVAHADRTRERHARQRGQQEPTVRADRTGWAVDTSPSRRAAQRAAWARRSVSGPDDQMQAVA